MAGRVQLYGLGAEMKMVEVLDLPCPTKRNWLERAVFHGIVFNMSWEDPEMDRRALQITPDDTVISITSAGCNPLNLLCQGPRKLISIDSNPAQTAVLELKLAGLATLDYETFFDIFAARRPAVVNDVYATRLRGELSARSREFWDRNLKLVARGLYNYGRMGLFCRILRRFLAVLGVPMKRADELFELRSLSAQKSWYDANIAPHLWSGFHSRLVKLFVNYRPLMYMAGVHPRQFNLVDKRHDMYSYIQERVEYALTQVPIYDNYFLSAAVTGKFRGERVPPYLMRENFEPLRQRLERVLVVNGWLGPFLDSQPPASISKFNLLDIFDWMTPEVFESTLQSVLRAAGPNARMIYRSGSYRLDPPASILAQVDLHPELASELLAIDRSATYGSFYVMSKKPVLQQASAPSEVVEPGHVRPTLVSSEARRPMAVH